MAPRKPASPAKPRRVTRARAADTDTKTALDEAPKRKTAPSKAVPTTSRTKAIVSKSRVTKKTDTKTTKSARSTPVVEVNDSNDEDEIVVAVAQPATRASRSTRTTTTTPATSTLAAAPRRRIKVTPLDAPAPEPAPAKEPEAKQVKKASAKEKKEKTTTSKSATTRTKRDMAAAELEEKVEEPKVHPMPKKRGRSRATKAEGEDAATETAATVRKTRGRAKKEDTPVEPLPPSQAPLPTKQTRARTGSTASVAVPEATINVVIPAPARKKVTFQDLPDDDDEKENKQPVTVSKSKAAKKGPTPAAAKKSETAAKGMRAKPIRKPAATTTKSTRGSSKAAKLSKTEETEKIMPRVLTPKKITQIAKAMPVENEDEEDELAGGKTPVRDLSLSPRRGEHVTSVGAMSPVKALDFTPALKSPEKSNANASPGIMSPPRRMPSSPFKDSLKESPRRAPEGVAIFRAQIQESSSNGSLSLNPSSHSQLSQSPKRGLSDKLVFPPSAMKPRQSPLKTALLSSPARRLFSPSKQKTPGHVSPSPIKKQGTPASEQMKSPGDVDLVMSSHFRSSMSPQRLAKVYRMSDDELAQEAVGQLDFDQSVLNIRSPLKVDTVKPQLNLPKDNMEVDEPIELNEEEREHDEELGVVEPAQIAPVADAEPVAAPDAASDDTVLDPDLEHQDVSDEDEEEVEEVHEQNSDEAPQDEVVPQAARQASITKPRLSNALFTRLREVDDESGDELAADQTPVARGQPSLSSSNIKSRLSGGMVPPSASRGLGFTPLAAQVRGWRADSPEKRSSPQKSTPASHGLFSPLARIHVAGSVEVNRQDTPAKQAQKRKSMAARLSFAPSMTESPARPDFFGESMAAQDFEEQTDELAGAVYAEEEDLHEVVQQVDVEEHVQEQEETSEDGGSDGSSHEPGELTTDLIKFTNASDTAMVDFEALANEAEEMAVDEPDGPTSDDDDGPEAAAIPGADLSTVEERQSMLSTSSENYGDENAAPAYQIPAQANKECVVGKAVAEQPLSDNAPSSDSEDELQSEEEDAISPPRKESEAVETYLLGDSSTSVALSPSAANTTSATVEKSIEMDFNVTPVRPDLSLARVVHTIAKVPLRPEGTIPTTSSPIKMQRKRPRSLSSSNSLAVKRRSLGLSPMDAVAIVDALATPRAKDQLTSSPQRRIRSAAPSPAHSLATGSTTPGQFSFAIEDFGNSTLDGIELPEDMMFSDEMEVGSEPEPETEGHGQEATVMTIGSALFKTPGSAPKRASMAPPPSTEKSNATATPHYARPTKSSRRKSLSTPSRPATAATPVPAETPAMTTKAKTPSTSLKSRTPAARTPLKPVGDGPLSGAVVHYDIHTSEGSNASAFYVDLLTSMGARCIKEWRWNPRASLAVNPDSAENEPEALSQAVGVTHVVYKDGGKRTLEKVRSAKGQVLCVGVSWVLDCYREQKWLDEAVYAVDTGIMPRGGSRRRKSMEPRILRNENGSLSATKQGRGRKSLPAAHFGNEDMKMKLAKTPVRALQQAEADKENDVNLQFDDEEVDSRSDEEEQVRCAGEVQSEGDQNTEEETELNSVYDSPAAATVGDGGETMDMRYLSTIPRDDSILSNIAATPMVASKKTSMETPQSANLQVDYDPRTAATPLTPYMAAKGMGRQDLVQMSAPPKQINRSIFECDDEEELAQEDDDKKEAGTKKKQKFQVRMRGKEAGGSDGARRRTLGANLAFKPVVASPLRRE